MCNFLTVKISCFVGMPFSIEAHLVVVVLHDMWVLFFFFLEFKGLRGFQRLRNGQRKENHAAPESGKIEK